MSSKLDVQILNGSQSDKVKVLITGAGMANYLLGTFAAKTTLPMIGISFSADVKNAAILAAQILSTQDKTLQRKLIEFRHKEAEKICYAV